MKDGQGQGHGQGQVPGAESIFKREGVLGITPSKRGFALAPSGENANEAKREEALPRAPTVSVLILGASAGPIAFW